MSTTTSGTSVGMGVFTRKEFTQIWRTWRRWVLPGVVALFAVTGPLTAKFMNELLRTVAGDQAGTMPALPDPTYLTSYQQWTSSLSQLVVFTVIVMLASSVAGERLQGTAVLMLTKPLSRDAFVLSKFVAQTVFVVGTVLVGTVLTWGVTYALFGEAPPARLFAATGIWLVLALVTVAVMLLASSALASTGGAIGMGFAVYFTASLLSLWGPLTRWTPIGLISLPAQITRGEAIPTMHWVMPVMTGLVAAAVCLVMALWVFRRQEL